MIDKDLLNSLYRKRLIELRDVAENDNILKGGSVEVLRARLIKEKILTNIDLSWDGIQSISHKEIGGILKIFGIKSSGSHKERRQRLWLHLNFDSRRMTIERLADMDRDTLYDLCHKLEMPLSGTRTVLMGRVAGVLTNQIKGWGKIKRSLHRSGMKKIEPSIEFQYNEILNENKENKQLGDFQEQVSMATIEDARDLMIIGIDKENVAVQGNLLSLQARIEELERMVGTILKEYGGSWSNSEKDLLIRLTERRRWPVEDEVVKKRLLTVATNIAEIKGAKIGISSKIDDFTVDKIDKVINRIRNKIKDSEELIKK
jgi:hypothetical protein